VRPLLLLPTRSVSCPPAVDLERASAGDDVPTVSAHLLTCESCRTCVERLARESEAFVSARPAERFLAQLEGRKQAPARSPRLVVATVVAVAVGLLVFLFPRTATRPAIVFKGSLVSLSLKRGTQVMSVREGDVLREGDALRFSVKAPRKGYALVLNRDGQGKVTVVAPFNATAPQGVAEGTTVLDDSAVLDATKGKEVFVTVFAPVAFDVGSIMKQLEAGKPVTCDGCVVEVSTFDKQ
jgi:hypothetical protein